MFCYVVIWDFNCRVQRRLCSNPGFADARSQVYWVTARAWQSGKRLLERAIAEKLDFAFETTLGANTMPRLLREAEDKRMAVNIWYAGLSSPELQPNWAKSIVAAALELGLRRIQTS